MFSPNFHPFTIEKIFSIQAGTKSRKLKNVLYMVHALWPSEVSPLIFLPQQLGKHYLLLGTANNRPKLGRPVLLLSLLCFYFFSVCFFFVYCLFFILFFQVYFNLFIFFVNLKFSENVYNFQKRKFTKNVQNSKILFPFRKLFGTLIFCDALRSTVH